MVRAGREMRLQASGPPQPTEVAGTLGSWEIEPDDHYFVGTKF